MTDSERISELERQIEEERRKREQSEKDRDLLKATVLALHEEKQMPSLPPEVEAAIAFRWADNVVASQLTRTVARTMLVQGKDNEEIVDTIRSAGVIVY